MTQVIEGKRAQAAREGRTVFTKSITSPPAEPRNSGGKIRVPLHVLVWAGSNRKISGLMQKGRWAGMPIFSLTLEERATCPSTCQQWRRCFGDNMHLAVRYQAGKQLEMAIEADLGALDSVYPDGYLIRLHVLGDFYSVSYVRFWERMLKQHECRLYGYTHRMLTEPIGAALTSLALGNPERTAFMRSDPTEAGDPLPSATVVDRKATVGVAGSVICPNETGKTESCGTCGLCMNGRTSVSFLDHSAAAVNAATWERRRAQLPQAEA